MSITIQNLNKHFGAYKALDDINLEVGSGELIALLGPSGCGKTSLLRIIGGLDVADSGRLLFHGEDVESRDARERNVGFVFQHYALFRHMTVFENVAFGLRVKPKKQRPSEAEIKCRVHELLNLVQLNFLADRYPAQLSGGQRQRIALARSLAVEPKILLLDEPFGALDAQVRKELRRWLRRLHDELHVTSVFVTHDQEEALEVADRVVVMNRGRIEQAGTPDEVYAQPATPFVYRFIGNVNLFHGRDHAPWSEQHGDAVAYVRPHDIDIGRTPQDDTALPVEVKLVRAIGAVVRVEVAPDAGSEFIEIELSRERFDAAPLADGDRVFIRPRQFRVFETGDAT
ncbi:sulfate/molybdate ABC transporter ATP-binding protein [Candidatus Ferrigenium straubiae]|jgi:sulfate transport system ATP-binding protein|uniref:sulfate/molybdate ABC transporter ATP-binding protein n=1 Tax=Candidatus Ferrigenium straubiae TaxID=2919506 RepID=UPI003F4A9A5F